MKHHMLGLPAALLCFLQVNGQTLRPFTLSGEVKGLGDRYVYLSYAYGMRESHIDSVMADHGKFVFHGKIKHPVSAAVYLEKNVDYRSGDVASLYLEPAAMKLVSHDGKLKEAKITGSRTQAEKEWLDASKAAAMAKIQPLNEAYNKGNMAYIDAKKAQQPDAVLDSMKQQLEVLKEQMEPAREEMEAADKKFIDAHPGSYLTAQLLRFRVMYMPWKEAEGYYLKMPPAVQQSENGRELKAVIDRLKKASPGSVAAGFSKTDINGQPLKLSDYKGKYVLLDFWASWCGPCRKGNPHLKELYGRYKDKGFEIVGVASDDSDPAAWKKAVAQDGIGIWKHVLCGREMQKVLKGQPNPDDVGENYGIQTLPTKILVGPDGAIIGRYGADGEDDEALNKKLTEIFGA